MRSTLIILTAASLLAVACAPEDKVSGVEPDVPETPSVSEPDPNEIKLLNNDFEEGLEGWTVKRYSNGDKADVEVADGKGVSGSKCLTIFQHPNDGPCCVGVERTLTGLEPDQMYRMTARVKYSDVPDGQGTGPVLFSPNTKQYWNSSKYLYGTNMKSWTTVTMDFLSDDEGNAKITAAMGFWQGGMANGGHSSGAAYFDDITVVKVTDELFTLESEHMRIFFEPSKVVVSKEILQNWLANLDKVYESYVELMGDAPHEGRKLAILTTRGMYSGYWALAGYPILWSINYSAVEDSLQQMKDHDDWCFGLLHEIGHVFNIGNSSWNWNDEMFANFRMHYALEMNAGKVYMNGTDGMRVYTGGEILDMYKIDYDNTIGTKVNDNGIHYMLARMADEHALGWEPFKKTFDYLRKTGGPSGTKYDKFVHFVETLGRYAQETKPGVDVWNYFTKSELTSIEKQLK